jgi:DNA replication protein DnaC
VLLKHHLKALKLPTVLAECEKVAQRCAADNADHLTFLLQLPELELLDRERRAAERRLKAARFSTLKTLEDFDFAAQPSRSTIRNVNLPWSGRDNPSDRVVPPAGPAAVAKR